MYYEGMEDEPKTEIERENMTVVYIGEVAVWVTIWEYYAKYNT